MSIRRHSALFAMATLGSTTSTTRSSNLTSSSRRALRCRRTQATVRAPTLDEVHIFQTEEQKALVEKKVKIAEATEKKVRDETIKVREETTRTLIDELEAATRKVDEFQGE
eukprot:CAMPEP_0172612238 /NCGR_PEP_ID=MMETSP1068-20121228/31789_1 /TAXON_ID=35684 /ORGANISM="Pseudopedinella elastica, Strain CCMP716" /LENGTH=110 /DNA_ID=CAMNT_0013416389 /DNA_START=30 /DNA_END=362 /DNA_ORIENTATION=-